MCVAAATGHDWNHRYSAMSFQLSTPAPAWPPWQRGEFGVDIAQSEFYSRLARFPTLRARGGQGDPQAYFDGTFRDPTTQDAEEGSQHGPVNRPCDPCAGVATDGQTACYTTGCCHIERE